MSYEHDFDNAADQWLRNHRYTADPQTLQRIAERVRQNLEQLGGVCAAASFERAYLELVAEKKIQPFRGTVTDHVAAEAIPADVIAWIENPRISAFEQRRRYSSDPVFRKQFDLYTKQQLQQQVAQEQAGVSLTVEEYRRIPAAQIAQKYHKDVPRGFRAAVDKLISEGRI
jgi:hypothetical protein